MDMYFGSEKTLQEVDFSTTAHEPLQAAREKAWD
jgi:hypothetical protein